MIVPRAVVLLSGGLDSATALAIARSQGFETHALTVDYGQRHRAELGYAGKVAAHLNTVCHSVLRVDLRAIGGSALTDLVEVPKDRTQDTIGTGIPVTYVPARNTVFLGLALAYAESVAAFDIFIGANVLDYSGYPDCRPEFLRAFEQVANLGTKAAVEGCGTFRVQAPLIAMTKAEIIRLGVSLGIDYACTLSCYDPDAQGRACKRCDSCQLRKKGFADAGVPDPTVYQ